LSSQFAACPNRRFKFDKRTQLFIGTHDEALSVAAMCRQSTAETQPQLQPALLRLSAMMSQYFHAPLDFAGFTLSTRQFRHKNVTCAILNFSAKPLHEETFHALGV
jgi:hypothetical protein